jgi:sugar phosphate isomerase/epimerase
VFFVDRRAFRFASVASVVKDSDMRRFGVSTHLFHGERLQREHLIAIAGHGFDAVELFATKSHFNYHEPGAVDALADWLRDSRLEMRSVHAPIVDSLVNDTWGRAYSTASRDEASWQATMVEMRAALEMSRRIPFAHFVLHLGIPDAQNPGPDDNSRSAMIRSIEEIHRMADPLGVRLALEVMGNTLSTVDALLDLIENDLDGLDLGICMDVGHAFLLGDTAEAIEAASGYLMTTHLHDNRRLRDDHLVPFQGAIDWAATMMAFEKIGYDGVFMFEVKSQQDAAITLERTARARQKLEGLVGSWELETGSFS